jgi:hypothetical protein
MAMVCFRHPQSFSAGICCRCAVGLCAGCVAVAHPPTCSRCLADLGAPLGNAENRRSSLPGQSPKQTATGVRNAASTELEDIGGRATTAAILAWTGALITWGVCGLLQRVSVGAFAFEPWRTIIAQHGLPILGIGAYVAAAAPYGWFVAGNWLAPRTRGIAPAARSMVVRSVVFGTIAIAPFVAPFGITNDIQRFRMLCRKERAARARAYGAHQSRLDRKPPIVGRQNATNLANEPPFSRPPEEPTE